MSGDEGTSPQGEAGPEPDSGLNGASSSWSKRVIGICTVVTAVVGVLGLILGLWQELSRHDEGDSASPTTVVHSSSPASTPRQTGSAPQCDTSGSHPVTVRLKEKPTRSEAHVMATVTCEAGPGDHLSWVVRKETGDPAQPHVHYTLRFDLGQGPGQYTYDAVLNTTAPGSVRSVFVVLMDEATYRAVKAGEEPETDYVELPSPTPIVSNSLLVTTPE